MKYNNLYKIKYISASFGAILTGFIIGLFLYGLLVSIPLINTANAETLSVSCSVTPISDTTATWTATVSGGSGSVSYSWSGTENLTNSTATVTKTYTTSGVKTGNVFVSSESSSASAGCSISITIPPASPQCSDGIDNDGDGLTDFPADLGCSSTADDDENDIPVITLVGSASIFLTTGDSFTDSGATASDIEDGDITSSIVVAGDTVNTATNGVYTITYNVDDSDGASAVEVTRVVTVSEVPVVPPPTCSGCGGGGTIITFKISNEKVEQIATSTALVTWDTNLQALSKVFYDTTSHVSTTLPFVEYATSTSKTNKFVTKHSMTITGLDLNRSNYFRPAAYRFGDNLGGIELSLLSENDEVDIDIPTTEICSEYLLEPIKFGADNNIVEVLKLQIFLNDFEGFSLDVTGIYNVSTFNAVKIFQEKYASDILEPWDMDLSTGYVYITTMKKINEIYCNKYIDFSLDALTQDQQKEVIDFRNLLKSLRAQGLPIPDDLNIGIEDKASDTSLAIDSSNESLDTDISEDFKLDSDIINNTSGSMASVISFADSRDENRTIIRFFNNIKNIFKILFILIF